MNSSSGGSHVLLFERDQQLAAMLTSELQFVGLECHTARTAVEVFDTIARYPVRLVLVNLAQAAAARREFWVALDTQRRGRGVQVFTFHCRNIAGYGPAAIDESDEPSQAVLADMDVDGMPGLTTMVNTIRARIAASGTSTGSLLRISPNGNHNAPVASDATPARAATMTFPASTPPANLQAANSSSAHRPSMTMPSTMQPLQSSTRAETQAAQFTPTDKMRTVIYPTQQTWTPSHESGASSAAVARGLPEEKAKDNGNGETAFPNESGLAQLSRMLQERDSASNSGSALLEELANGRYGNELDRVGMIGEPREAYTPQTLHVPLPAAPTGPRNRPIDQPMPLSSLGLRASPIEDLPSERTEGGYAATSSLVSINTPPSQTLQAIAPVPKLATAPISPTIRPTAQPEADKEDTLVHPAAQSYRASENAVAPETQKEPPTPTRPSLAGTAQKMENPSRTERSEVKLVEQLQAIVAAGAARSAAVETSKTTGAGTDQALFLDIVQSLPAMPSPPPQQALNGRATRSLSNVLLEGHLVPQDRLEVAQNIQRMLRGVDMNYQLGEILLMFKLLTPDQLLAASLVSYGLISALQIRSLGRIRQELYSIGLEYDLENLLILFRILTSEQLREVRASWSS
jgi:hypothetical protein